LRVVSSFDSSAAAFTIIWSVLPGQGRDNCNRRLHR
jgi:hypothetical protein